MCGGGGIEKGIEKGGIEKGVVVVYREGYTECKEKGGIEKGVVGGRWGGTPATQARALTLDPRLSTQLPSTLLW